MRPRANLPASEAKTDELVQQVREWITALGFSWNGPGGAFRIEDLEGRQRWRVYSEWAGSGVTADLDAQTGELLSITDAEFEQIGERLQIPDHLRPTPLEVSEFTRTQLQAIGWILLDPITATWDQENQIWLVTAKTAGSASSICAQAAGKKGYLRLVEVKSE